MSTATQQGVEAQLSVFCKFGPACYVTSKRTSTRHSALRRSSRNLRSLRLFVYLIQRLGVDFGGLYDPDQHPSLEQLREPSFNKPREGVLYRDVRSFCLPTLVSIQRLKPLEVFGELA